MPSPVRLIRSKNAQTIAIAWLNAVKRRRGKDLDSGGVPVEPNRPNTLTGGAAAALEFDE